MADSEIDSGGLFAIQLSDAEDDSHGDNTKKSTADRTGQTEEEFQRVRSTYRVKVENGELHRSIQLPIGSSQVTKPQAQALLHAVEELYFLRRYTEGAGFVRRIFGDDDVDTGHADGNVNGVGTEGRKAEAGNAKNNDKDSGGELAAADISHPAKANGGGGGGGGGGSSTGLDEDMCKLLRYYQTKCEEKEKEMKKQSLESS